MSDCQTNINNIRSLLSSFIDGDDRSLEIAGKIEVALDNAFPDNEEIQDYMSCFASYRPGGGEY